MNLYGAHAIVSAIYLAWLYTRYAGRKVPCEITMEWTREDTVQISFRKNIFAAAETAERLATVKYLTNFYI